MSETESPDRNGDGREALVDENEQLQTALEAALEENARLNDDRDRLQRRATLLAQELRATAPPRRSRRNRPSRTARWRSNAAARPRRSFASPSRNCKC